MPARHRTVPRPRAWDARASIVIGATAARPLASKSSRRNDQRPRSRPPRPRAAPTQPPPRSLPERAELSVLRATSMLFFSICEFASSIYSRKVSMHKKVCTILLQPIPADMRLRISNAEFRNLDSVNHCTSKEMPNLDSVNHCTSKTESRFGISKFGIPIEIRSTV